MSPFGLASNNEVVDHDGGSICKVTELSFPDDQTVGVCDGISETALRNLYYSRSYYLQQIPSSFNLSPRIIPNGNKSKCGSYNFIVTSFWLIMFEGQRLSYVVPGYTGHIPKKVYDQFQAVDKQEAVSKIPGYAGYVPAIKPQNLYGNTFGKTTLDVGNTNFVKGQDFEAKHKYVTSHTTSHIPPSERLQRTAADIVGVPNTKIVVKEPTIENPGKEVDQFTLTKNEAVRKSLTAKDNKWVDTKLIEKEGKEYVQLGNPLPGYTGFGKRVLANNIFGKTYAESLKEAKRDDERLHHEKNRNFHGQLNSDVPLKF